MILHILAIGRRFVSFFEKIAVRLVVSVKYAAFACAASVSPFSAVFGSLVFAVSVVSAKSKSLSVFFVVRPYPVLKFSRMLAVAFAHGNISALTGNAAFVKTRETAKAAPHAIFPKFFIFSVFIVRLENMRKFFFFTADFRKFSRSGETAMR